GPDSLLDLTADCGGSAKKRFTASNVEKRFIERQGLNQGRKLLKDVADLPRHRGVIIDSRPNNDGLGAQAVRPSRGHGTMNAEFASFVVRGCDYAARFRCPTNNYRLSHQRRIFP